MTGHASQATWVAFLSVALLAAEGVAHAQPAPAPAPARPPIRLAVEVPAECPSDLAIQILSRTPNTRLAREGEPARRVGARIVQVADRYRGAVALDGVDGEPVVRQVEGPSCDEVTAALALIAALAIDPDATMSPISPVPPTSAPPPAPPPPLPPPPAPEPEDRGLEVQPAIEVGFGVMSGLAPRATVGGTLMLELGIPRKKPFVLVRAGAGYWGNGQIAVIKPDGTADVAALYRAALARIETCLALRWQPFWGGPCATFDVGSLMVEGAEGVGDIQDAQQQSQLWAAPGPALRVGWDAIGPLTLVLDGALTFPLKQDRYVFEQPPQLAHEVPPVAARGGAYAALHFR